MTQKLQSTRLVFRRFRHTDADLLAKLVNDFEIARWIGPMPHPYTIEMARTYLDQVLSSGENTFALERNGCLVGAIGIRTMLGFWLARAHWGQGLMTEAAEVMITDHFANGATSLVSGYLTGNHASKRVHEKLGFKPNGTSQVFSQANGREVERHDLYLTQADWQARR